MKFVKILSFAAGLSVLLPALTTTAASALGTASMTLSGISNTNGSFSVIVYEDTGSDTVTGANVELSFSQAVGGVSYDYSVGPFTAATPSGAHNAYGTVTGTNAVARVSFTLANPGTVTASVNGNSYLKHAEGTTVESFTINRGSADFTYTAPSTGGGSDDGSGNGGSGNDSGSTGNGSSNNGSSSSSSNTASSSSDTSTTSDDTTAEVKDAETTKADDSKKSDDSDSKKDDTENADNKSGSKAWAWLLVLAVAAGAYYLTRPRRTPGQKAKQAKEAEAALTAAADAEAGKGGEPNEAKEDDGPKGDKKGRHGKKNRR